MELPLMENQKPFKAFFNESQIPSRYFGVRFMLGMLTLIGASWVFVGIAEDVMSGGPLTIVDTQLAAWFHAHSTLLLTQFMLILSNLQGTLGMSIFALLFGIFLVRKKQHYWLLALILTVPGGMLLNILMKQVFHRVRASFTDPIITLSTYSFPSGHAAGTTLFYGILTAFLITHISIWRWRIVAIMAAIMLVVLVGFSRIYLGVHYLSDVLAAVAEGVAWLALCLTAVHLVRQRRTAQRLTP
jgi:membrane-associated phospholipid phosphatase